MFENYAGDYLEWRAIMSANPHGLTSVTLEGEIAGKFKREFESEAVVNDPDFLWG